MMYLYRYINTCVFLDMHYNPASEVESNITTERERATGSVGCIFVFNVVVVVFVIVVVAF